MDPLEVSSGVMTMDCQLKHGGSPKKWRTPAATVLQSMVPLARVAASRPVEPLWLASLQQPLKSKGTMRIPFRVIHCNFLTEIRLSVRR